MSSTLEKTEALFKALEDRNFNNAKMLLEHGANPNLLLMNGVTPLHFAIRAGSTASYKYVKLLLKFKGNPNVCDSDGITPLHIAAQWDKADCLSLLLQHGANLFQRDSEGRDAQWFAQESRHCKLIIDQYMDAITDDFESCDDNNLFVASHQSNNEHFSVQDALLTKDRSAELVLDATSPDNCYFVNKPKNLDENDSINCHDTLIVPKDYCQVSPENCMSKLSNLYISDLKEKSLDSKTNLSTKVLEAEQLSDHCTSNDDISSIRTFADSTPVINNISADCPSEISCISNSQNDFNFKKMILGTKACPNTINHITPKSSKLSNSFKDPSTTLFPPLSNKKNVFAPECDGDFSNTEVKLLADDLATTSCNSKATVDFRGDSSAHLYCSENKSNVRDNSRTSIWTAEKSSISANDCVDEILSSNHLMQNVSNDGSSLTSSTLDNSAIPIKLSLSVSDNVASDDTIIYDWQSLVDCSNSYEEISGKQSNETSLLPADIENLTDEQLRDKLLKFGVRPGPIQFGRKQYKKQLYALQKGKTASTFISDCRRSTRVFHVSEPTFSRELESVLKGNSLPRSVVDDDESLRKEFDNPAHCTRGGPAKDSFNYLLLDPRITNNLPKRAKSMSEAEALKLFAGATFYVGKGKKSRPYAHLKEALRASKTSNSRKLQHINEIWKTDGVVSLHVFQNILGTEAFTREAAMIEAFGLNHLTNHIRGKCYGSSETWDKDRLRRYGTFLIIRAMQMLLLEGERQIRPHQISN